MIHLLIIAADGLALPRWADLGSAGELKSVRKPELASARPLLEAGLFDGCLICAAKFAPREHRTVEEFRVLAPLCPLVVALSHGSPEDERAAYQAGADAVVDAALEPAAAVALLRRLVARGAAAPATAATVSPVAVPAAAPTTLAVMRDFSQVFSYSLDYQEFTRHFVVKLREIIGATRIAIFLERPRAVPLGAAAGPPDKRLFCAGAVGLPAELIECIVLSRDSGLGQRVLQTGRILRLGAESAAPFLAADPRLQREFEILGCEIALPVNDRERTIGVALLGGRLTGAPFSDAELLLVYHLMEELGLAVKNSWLHHELAASHHLLSDVLGAMTSGALVLGADLEVRFANQALRQLLGGDTARVDLTTLPPVLANGLRDAVEQGKPAAPFLYEHPGNPPRATRATIIPFAAAEHRPPQPALLLLEDFTQIRAAQRAEIEASNLRLIGLIARRFAHEIRNSLVPLTTHQQLFDTDYANAEFRDSLKHALTRETGRIQRFTEQMLFLAQAESGVTDVLPLEELLRKSFARSRDFLGEAGELEILSEIPGSQLRGHRPSLGHALQEIFLNGLQSAGSPPRVRVAIEPEVMADGRPGLALKFHDSGRGFTPDVAARATDPFFTTRNTGVGLGLTVAKRVVEAHAGRLDVQVRREPGDPDLILHLPLNL